MSEFRGYGKTQHAKDARAAIKKHQAEQIVFAGKVKLHGTNAGVEFSKQPGGELMVRYMSRNRYITPESDNQGFASFARENVVLSDMATMALASLAAQSGEPASVTIFGEFYGGSVQRSKAACSQVDTPHFAIFAVRLHSSQGTFFITEPDAIVGFGEDVNGRVTVIEWQTTNVTGADLHNVDTVESVERAVEAIGEVCPYTLEMHGVTGPGEGLVFMPRHPPGTAINAAFFNLKFKVKAAAFAEHKGAPFKPVPVDTGAVEFAANTVLPERVQHAIAEIGDGKENIGALIKWVVNDVFTECASELAGVDHKVYRKAVGAAAAEAVRAVVL